MPLEILLVTNSFQEQIIPLKRFAALPLTNKLICLLSEVDQWRSTLGIVLDSDRGKERRGQDIYEYLSAV